MYMGVRRGYFFLFSAADRSLLFVLAVALFCMGMAFGLFLAEIILRRTVLRTLP